MSPRTDQWPEGEDADSQSNLRGDQLKMTNMSGVTSSQSASSKPCQETAALKPVPASQLFRYADRKDRCLIAAGLIAAVLSACTLPLVFVVYSGIMEALTVFGTNQTADGSAEFLSEANAAFTYSELGLALCMLLLSGTYVFCFSYAASRQARRIKVQFLRSALRQDIAWYDSKQMGDFTTRVTEDLKKIEDGIGEKVGMAITLILILVFGLAVAFYSGWKLTLVIGSFVPVMVISGSFMAKLQASFAQKEAEAYSKAGSAAEEAIGAIRTVMAFGGEHKEAQRYAKSLQGARTAMLRRSVVTGLGAGMVKLTQFCSITVAFWYGTRLVMESRESGDGLYTAGTLTVIFFNIMIGAVNVGYAAPHIEAMSTARGAAAAVYSVIERKSVIDPHSPDGAEPGSVTGLLELRNVRFSYPSRPETQVLRGVSLTVRPGQTVALVGSSGCGKSTCIQLIQRFYDPLQGEVLLDGRSISELNVSWLRRQIGVVSQEPVLFGTTIAENIGYGYPDCTMNDIEQAARQANAFEFIQELPLKFDTLVGQKGAQLSGGQKQRIAIARALVRNPRVFLLDEATSALDLRSEAVVQAALDRARSGRTTIVVAHRLSTVRTADLICTMKDGQVVETGSHEQLMQQKGVYHGLVMSQMRCVDADDEEMEREENEEKFTLHSSRRSSTSETAEKVISDLQVHRDSVTLSTRGANGKTGLTISSTAAEEKGEEEEESLPVVSVWRILAMNRWEWPFLLFGVLAAAVMGATLPTYAIVFGIAYRNLADTDAEKAVENAKWNALLFFALGVISFIASFAQAFMFGIAGERLTSRVRKLMFTAILRQEVSFFDGAKNTVGSLCAKLSEDASGLQGVTGTRLSHITQAIFTLLLGFLVSFYLSWKLALVGLPFVPLCGLATYIEGRQNQGDMGRQRSEQERGNQIAVEAISNIRTVASLGLEEMFADQYEQRLEITHRKYIKMALLRGLVFGIAQSMVTLAFAAVYSVGLHLVIEESLPYYSIFIIGESLIYGTMMIGQAVAFSPDFQKAFVAAKQVFALLDRKPAIDSSTTAGLKLPQLTGTVSLEGVVFRYPTRPGVTVLRELSLEVRPGQQVALVGASGCGKSTCVQLLERFYDTEHGDVKVDGQSVAALNLSWLRSNIGIVSQEPVLFDKTIRENIAYGDNSRDVPMAEIIGAARDANIHSFIASLPAGYDTQLGSSNSTQLSGGQKQRIAIARALVRRPAILLLDEATSALDTESEVVVQEALDRAASGRTCLVIAHRLSTVQGADKIAVIHRGRVVEQGTHQELLSRKGAYYQLYKTMA